jgi:hypothetical protein
MADISHTVYVHYKKGAIPWQRKLYAKSQGHARSRLLDFIMEEDIKPEQFKGCEVHGPESSVYTLNYKGDRT